MKFPDCLSRRQCVLALGLGALAALGGCASPAPMHPQPPDALSTQASPEATHWIGRLALTIESDPVQHFSASFELWGNADPVSYTHLTLPTKRIV